MIISVINVSLDGFCNHMDVIADNRHHEFNNQLIEQADIILLGRVTFQLFENFWPKALNDDSLPQHMRQTGTLLTNKQKWVVSSFLSNSDWKNTRFIKNLDPETISGIQQTSKTSILILGSPAVITTLSQSAVIDEYIFLIQPLISGKGKRLFEQALLSAPLQLKIDQQIRLDSGVNILHYKRPLSM
ncbi:dihydrofolate reductase family protein [Gynurincola endophyticus]|uniref:dihydrofolate reductase family protein n=1 Tax=Gynurincola endophyticus TaxID=2479004 RepID=UPI000F8DE606|nr:dihydrofolate reductase family protein [Gynurincola endophyticus]